MIKINKENYYSNEVNKQYMSVSLFKNFLKEYGGCEAKAMAKLKGEWTDAPNPAFLIGSYVHAWSEGKLDEFKAEHPEILSSRGATKGQLKKDFQIADKMIATLDKDKLINMVRKGEKEVIIAQELFGIPWKAQLDILGSNHFADLKTTRDFAKKYWNEFEGKKENFIEHYGYDIQMAIYAELERLDARRGKHLMPHIIAVTKEDIPDKIVINMGTEFIEETLLKVQLKLPRVVEVWRGQAEPERCECCDYCKSTKQLKKTVFWKDL